MTVPLWMLACTAPFVVWALLLMREVHNPSDSLGIGMMAVLFVGFPTVLSISLIIYIFRGVFG